MKRILLLILLLLPCIVYGYTPIIVPNGRTLEYEMDGDVKVFHLIAEPVKQMFAPGLEINCWGYNGISPGPVIEAVEGERVRILVTNNLPEYTSVHWHGLILPNGMDGVEALTQPRIKPGETWVYEFDLVQNGTYMYHPHADDIIQFGMGLMGMLIIHPNNDEYPVDRDFVIMTNMFQIPQGATTPEPMMMEANYFTFNGAVFPGTESLVAKKGDRVRIRWGNLSMQSHPIHLHGYEFTVTRRGGWRIPDSAQYTENTVDIPVGGTVDFEFIADNLGDWAMHCHKVHHLMNGMSHRSMANLLGTHISNETVNKIKKHLPQFMPMGVTGMGMMFYPQHELPIPPNFLPLGGMGPYGTIDMGGMFTIFKVREELTDDPGWYHHPPGTSAWLLTEDK